MNEILLVMACELTCMSYVGRVFARVLSCSPGIVPEVPGGVNYPLVLVLARGLVREHLTFEY